jgi:hypothetical protein
VIGRYVSRPRSPPPSPNSPTLSPSPPASAAKTEPSVVSPVSGPATAGAGARSAGRRASAGRPRRDLADVPPLARPCRDGPVCPCPDRLARSQRPRGVDVTGSLRSQLYWALASIALTTSVAAACENVTVNLSEVASQPPPELSGSLPFTGYETGPPGRPGSRTLPSLVPSSRNRGSLSVPVVGLYPFVP